MHLGFAEQSSGEEGAMQRKSSRKLHRNPLSLWLNTWLCMCMMSLHEFRNKENTKNIIFIGVL